MKKQELRRKLLKENFFISQSVIQLRKILKIPKKGFKNDYLSYKKR